MLKAQFETYNLNPSLNPEYKNLNSIKMYKRIMNALNS